MDTRALPAGGELLNDDEWLCWDVETKNPEVKHGDFVSKFGFKFQWTPMHRLPADLMPLRTQMDPQADAVVPLLSADVHADHLEVIQSLHRSGSCEAASKFWNHVTTVPRWVDWDSVKRAQLFYLEHAVPIGIVLFHLSLVGGFSAPLINRVLTSTGYLNKDKAVTYHRIIETFQMIFECCSSSGSDGLAVGGLGWESAVRVRLLHAHVRRRLLQSKKFLVSEWGQPINQEDMTGTLLSFSYNSLLGLELMGFRVSKQQQEDFTHMWRYIGYIMGVMDEHNPCSSFDQSKAWMESIVMHLIDPDETSATMAQHSVTALTDRPPLFLSFATLSQMSRFLMGTELSNILGLPDTWKGRIYVTFLIALMRVSKFVLPNSIIRSLNVSRFKTLLSMSLDGRSKFVLRKPLTNADDVKVMVANSAISKIESHSNRLRRINSVVWMVLSVFLVVAGVAMLTKLFF